MDFRGPYDIVNLGLLFNFKEEQSKAAISKSCRAVLFHAQARKGTERSVISGRRVDEHAKDIVVSTCSRGKTSKDVVTEDSNNKDDNYEPKDKRAKAE